MPPKHGKKTVDAPVPTMIPSPVKQRPAGITQAQKQALIDNLQLEITERARKLRAQYALQAQGLRTRLEMRVNRIPPAMRKRKIGDLVDEYARKNEPKEPEQQTIAVLKSPVKATEVERKSLKRQSEFISVNNSNDEKENAPQPASSQQDQPHHEPLPNPKKRAKPTPSSTTANTKATRTASRKVVASHPVVVVPAPPHGGVLSPKSHNSRTLPRSPFKQPGLSPEKQAMVERLTGVSPVKQQLQQQQQQQQQYMLAPRPAARAPSRQTRTPVEDLDELDGRTSEGSTGTTIITKPAVSKVGRLAAGKKAVKAAVGRKPAVAKKENIVPVAAPVGGGRTLRKRG
ncbi:hypothetical protein LTR27_010999 [Elasticomyces elasticus]|nr:hypothetical protein LTR27_010999 [Elasticomyces elasticus]